MTGPEGQVPRTGGRRSPLFLAIVGTIAVLFFLLFVALGTWQVKRRAWKLDLIARVEQRVNAPATAAPGPAQWPNVTAASDEYRHVFASGTFLDASQTLVQAVTDLGAGYWVLTPLQGADGSVVFINRGFVPADDRNRVQPAAASPEPGTASPVTASASSTVRVPSAAPAPSSAPAGGIPAMSTVTGLLRITEPSGGFLRHNNPAANQWYSRDVQAIAAARGLTHVAPYFIDAEAPTHAEADSFGAAVPADGGAAARLTQGQAPMPGPTVLPIPGLTVIHFHNSHLVYAVTWYTLALMVAIAIPLGMRKQ